MQARPVSCVPLCISPAQPPALPCHAATSLRRLHPCSTAASQSELTLSCPLASLCSILPLEVICNTIEGNVSLPNPEGALECCPQCCAAALVWGPWPLPLSLRLATYTLLTQTPGRLSSIKQRASPLILSPPHPGCFSTQVWELHRMHSANGVEQQREAGVDVMTAEALVDIMAPQTMGGLAFNGNGAAAYVNGNGNGAAYVNGNGNGAATNGAATNGESGTVRIPPEELIRAAQGLRQRVSSSLRQ